MPEALRSTNKVASLARVSLRQLQWWDETGLVVPSYKAHCRTGGKNRGYTAIDTFLVLVAADLRRKKLTPRWIKPVLEYVCVRKDEIKPYTWLVISGKRHKLVTHICEVDEFGGQTAGPVYVVDLWRLADIAFGGANV